MRITTYRDAYNTLSLSGFLGIVEDTLWHVSFYDALGSRLSCLHVNCTIVLKTKSRLISRIEVLGTVLCKDIVALATLIPVCFCSLVPLHPQHPHSSLSGV